MHSLEGKYLKRRFTLKLIRISTICVAMLIAVVGSAFAGVKTDYDKGADFSRYKTYSWQKVNVKNPLWVSRIQDAVDSQLSAKGWRRVDEGGDASLVASCTTQTERTLQTFYDGMGGGWGWRRFGGGGFGSATTTEQDYKEGTLVVDIFDASSKQLLWRGDATGTVNGNPDKQQKNLDKEVQKMFKKFPPKSKA